MLAIGIVGSNSLALGPIASTVAQSFNNTSATDVMLASALFGLGTVAGALTLAPRSDRFGLNKALRYSLVLLLLGFLVSASAPALWVLCVGQTIAGVASGVVLPCTYGLAAEIAPEGEENETLGKVLLGWTLSMVVGVTVASYIAEWLHWRGVYSLLVIAAGVVLTELSKASDNQTTADKKLVSVSSASVPSSSQPFATSSSPWLALTIPNVFPGLLSVSAFMIAFYCVYGFLGTHLTTQLGASTVTGGFSALIYGVGFGVVSPLDKWMDKYGPVYSAAWVFSTLVLIYIAIGLVASSTHAILWLCFLWGATNHLALNLLVAKLNGIDSSRRASIMGLYSATTYFSMFLGTLVFKSVYDSFGFSILGFSGALLILPVAAIAVKTAFRCHKQVPFE